MIYANKKRSHICCNSLIFCVGVPGFEPGTPCSQSRCASRTALCPDKLGGEGGIRTPGSLWDYDSLANCWFQPLTHLSVFRGFASAKVHLFFIYPTLFSKKIIFFIFTHISTLINTFVFKHFYHEKALILISLIHRNFIIINILQ